MDVWRLLLPALRWDDARGFDPLAGSIEQALAAGVGGFILFGGEADAVRELTAGLRRRALRPLLIAADLERGAGQQFRGATPLPPLAAIGALDDHDATRRAAELTAREAVALGVNWVLAPVADVDLEPRNPIVGTRAFGTDPGHVAGHVSAWVEGCRAGGALCCAKHFPGHGRTVVDSHAELPTVEHGGEELEYDLAPFRAAVDAGADAIMTAHVAYPALDASGLPATLSRPILKGLLRRELRFRGLVVTDSLTMQGVSAAAGDAAAAVRALAAGCDALLYPSDPGAVAAALQTALESGELDARRVADAIARVERAASAAERRAGGPARAESVRSGSPGRKRAASAGSPEAGAPRVWGQAADRAWALQLAERTLRVARGAPALPAAPAGALDLLTVDDDLGGPYPAPPRDAFRAALAAAGVPVREVAGLSPERPALIALYSDIRAWKGRSGLSGAAARAVAAAGGRPDVTVVLFGHPRLVGDVTAAHVLTAWGGEPLMQEAAARWLTAGGGPGGPA